MTVTSTDPRAAQRATLRRAVFHLVLGVAVVHAVALAVYYLGDIPGAASRTRTIFMVTWTVATAATVSVLLRRVRLARDAGRRRR